MRIKHLKGALGPEKSSLDVLSFSSSLKAYIESMYIIVIISSASPTMNNLGKKKKNGSLVPWRVFGLVGNASHILRSSLLGSVRMWLTSHREAEKAI